MEKAGTSRSRLSHSFAARYLFTGAVVGFRFTGRAVAAGFAGAAGAAVVLVTAGLAAMWAVEGMVFVAFFVAVACLWAGFAIVAWCGFAFVATGLAVDGCCVEVAGCCAVTAVAVSRLAPRTVAIRRVFMCSFLFGLGGCRV